MKKQIQIDEMQHLPDTVSNHSEIVRKIVVYLAEEFIKVGINIDKERLEQAAILHDCMKPIDFSKDSYWVEKRQEYKGMTHEDAAYILIKNIDEKVARIVKEHSFFQVLEGFSGWEEKLLYYADKRVDWDKITPLKTRLDNAKKRYNYLNNTLEDEKLVKKVHEEIFRLEKEIFNTIRKDPEILKDL